MPITQIIDYSFKSDAEVMKIASEDSLYPSHVKHLMGKNAPQYLYMKGNRGLLELPAIGFCGSRKSSEKGLAIARDCSEQVVSQNMIAVSGNAAGVDFTAHYHSLKAGGKTIFVLPEGINHFRIRKSLRDVWDWNNVLVVSQFAPDDRWQAFRAMARNKLIIALSQVMIVIEAGEKGGTLNAGMQTLKSSIPLFVAEYENMPDDAKGNQILLNMGACKLSKSRQKNHANFKPIVDMIKRNVAFPSVPQQSALL